MAGELITANCQVQFGSSLLMGAGTPYHVDADGVEGWEDLPGFDAADTSRPGSDGLWAGDRHAGGRVVTIPVTVDPMADTALRSGLALLRALQLATRMHAVEQPLAIRLHDETLMCWARINARVTRALTAQWSITGVLPLPVQFICTDPRRYSLSEHSLSAGPPVRSEGLQYAAVGGIDRIDYVAVGGIDRLDWGVDGSSGDVAAVNSGTESTPGMLRISGPVTTPAVTVQSAEAGTLVLEYDIDLVATDVLTVDARTGRVLLNGSADRAYTVTARSGLLEDLMFAPGETRVGLRGAVTGAGAAMTVTWRDAYM